MTKWSVWSKGADDQAWMVVVDSVTRKEADEAVARKRAAAERHGVAARYVSLPDYQEPSDYGAAVAIRG